MGWSNLTPASARRHDPRQGDGATPALAEGRRSPRRPRGLRPAQARACTLESDIDFRRARDRKDFRDLASSAQFYSDFLSEKIKRTKASNRASASYTGGGPAFGYAKGPVVDPEQAALIHEAVKQLARGATLYRLAQAWKDAGVTTANGNRWNPTGMRRLLTGEHLTGGNGYPAILTDVEAAIVREKLAVPRGRTGCPSGRRYAVSKLVYCAECGTKLTAAVGTLKGYK